MRIVVTGASRGIGLQLTRHLVADGHRVVGAVRDPAGAAALTAITDVVALDVDRPTTLERLDAAVGAHLDEVDVLVNNAGIKRVADRDWVESAGPLSSVDRDAVLAVLSTNAVGPLLVTRALLSRLRRPGGVVVNVSSQLGSLAAGIGVDYAYNASKAALNMVTRTMARDLGEFGIVPVALNPGWIATDMTADDDAPLDPVPTTREIADLIVRLDSSLNGCFVDRFGSTVPW